MVPTSIAFFERGGSASRPPKMCTKTFSRYFSLRISASKTRNTSGAGSSVSLPIVASSTTGRPPRSGRLLCRMSRSMSAFALWREILASRRRTSTKTARFGNMWTLSHRSSGNASIFSMWRDTQRRKLPQWCNRARRRCADA